MIQLQDVNALTCFFSKNCSDHCNNKVLFCVFHDKFVLKEFILAAHLNCKNITDIDKAAFGIKKKAVPKLVHQLNLLHKRIARERHIIDENRTSI